MKLIIGLGNPGRQYERTRHNVGFMAVDRLARRHAGDAAPRGRFHAAVVEATVRGERLLLMKPTTYMNRSGASVAEAARFYKVEPSSDLLVIVDDVALPTGQVRLRGTGGAGGHNGLDDIERALGTQDYPRCRVGIGASPEYMDQADYVLGRFTEEEWSLMDGVLDTVADAAEVFVAEGIEAAMNRFNVRAARQSPPRPEGGGSGDAQREGA